MSHDLRSCLVRRFGKALSFMRRIVFALAASPGGFPDRLAGVAPGARVPRITLKARRPA